MRDPTVIDLFCGGGGLSLGAHLAGMRTAVAVDVDTNLSSSLIQNLPSARVVNADLSTLEPTELQSRMNLERPSAIVGGPPCQGFSIIGRRQSNDPRNQLMRHFFQYVRYFRPNFFLMENVPGLFQEANKDQLSDALSLLPGRYIVLPPMILDAADYGAATTRKRLVVVGYDPEYVDNLDQKHFASAKSVHRTTVRDAIHDLPKLQNSPFDGEWLRYPKRTKISEYAKTMRTPPSEGCGDPLALQRLREGLVSGCQITRHTEEVENRFASMSSGERDPISKYPKLDWNRTAYVLRAGTGADRGSYQAARPIHPKYPRVISVREAARIQGFPDWFQFHPTKWHSHRIIGNSVSPLFAKSLLEVAVSKFTDVSNRLAAE